MSCITAGLEVFYNGEGTGIHGGNDGILEEFTLKPGEFITSSEIFSGWLIDSLTFFTNKGKYGPYGGDGGGQRIQKPAEALKLEENQVRLAYFKGSMLSTQGQLAIINLTYVWAYEGNPDKEEIPVIKNNMLLEPGDPSDWSEEQSEDDEENEDLIEDEEGW